MNQIRAVQQEIYRLKGNVLFYRIISCHSENVPKSIGSSNEGWTRDGEKQGR